MQKLWALVCMVVAVASIQALAQGKAPTKGDKSAIEALEKRYMEAFNARDVDGIMACYARGNDLFVFDAVPPREYPSAKAYRKDWEGLFASYPGPLSNKMSDQSITVVGTVAYGHNIQTGYFTAKSGARTDVVVRTTDVYRKINGKWLIVQEHVSFPVDIDTAKADLMSKP